MSRFESKTHEFEALDLVFNGSRSVKELHLSPASKSRVQTSFTCENIGFTT